MSIQTLRKAPPLQRALLVVIGVLVVGFITWDLLAYARFCDVPPGWALVTAFVVVWALVIWSVVIGYRARRRGRQ